MKIGDAVLHFFKDSKVSLDSRRTFPGHTKKQWSKLYLELFD